MFHLATPHASSGRPGLEFARKACSFVGPGFLISVAYIDPGNYATDIAAGATYRFRLLFVVLLANIFAIFLQSLAIKLGTVSGLDLAQACRAFLPAWLNYLLYFFAEVAIIATDVAEVGSISPPEALECDQADAHLQGHRLCHCSEPAGTADPARGRMCHLHLGCHAHPPVLPTRQVHEWAPRV